MAVPALDGQSLPASGSTNWYAHYSALDTDVRNLNDRPGEVWVHHMPGATFNDRLQAAVTEAKTGVRKIVRCWQEGGVSDIVTTSIEEYSGMDIRGPVDDLGMQNREQNSNSVPFTMRVANSGGVAGSLIIPSASGTLYGMKFSNMALVATNTTTQFWDHPAANGTAFSCTLMNLAWHGFKHVLGRPTERLSATLWGMHGYFQVLPQAGSSGGDQFNLRGSDCWFTPAFLNINWSNSPAGTYQLNMGGLVKSHFANWYFTVDEGAGRAIYCEGYSTAQEGVYMRNCVIEGQNQSESAAGSLVRVASHGDLSLTDCPVNFAMVSPASTSPTSTGYIEAVTAGRVTCDNLRISRSSTVAETTRVIHGDGAGTKVNATRIFGTKGNGNTWTQKPLVQVTNSAVIEVSDASIRTS